MFYIKNVLWYSSVCNTFGFSNVVFTLGASIRESKNTDISNFTKNALISLSVIIYVGYNCFQIL